LHDVVDVSGGGEAGVRDDEGAGAEGEKFAGEKLEGALAEEDGDVGTGKLLEIFGGEDLHGYTTGSI